MDSQLNRARHRVDVLIDESILQVQTFDFFRFRAELWHNLLGWLRKPSWVLFLCYFLNFMRTKMWSLPRLPELGAETSMQLTGSLAKITQTVQIEAKWLILSLYTHIYFDVTMKVVNDY